jgi:acetyl/propionyl-CoA carboxylase alpha subunit
MIAKVIAHAPTREAALEKLAAALDGCGRGGAAECRLLGGCPALARDARATMDTRFLEAARERLLDDMARLKEPA